MGVYGLPGTVKIWHFELTQDHLDTDVTEGLGKSLCLFCLKPLQYGRLLTPAVKIWQVTQDHQDTEDTEAALSSFLSQTPAIWVSTDLPGPQQLSVDILS